MTETTYLLGKTIENQDAERDAIHIAVAPVVANERLYPGQHAGLSFHSGVERASSNAKKMIGVVDPFLKHAVEPGQRFWLFLYPGSIRSLRHTWQHDAFVNASPTSRDRTEAIKWMKEYAEEVGADYDELLARAATFVEHGDYWVKGGTFEGIRADDTFWDAYEIVAGVTVPRDKRGGLFSCAC